MYAAASVFYKRTPDSTGYMRSARWVCIVRRKPEKLQDTCFNVVSQNFEILIKRSSPKGIKFLEKNCQRLLESFKKTDGQYVSLKHFMCCLNPYLKELDMYWLAPQDVFVVLDKLKTVEITLTALYLRGYAWSNSGNVLWQLIHALPKTLLHLTLQFNSDCTDDMLKVVAQLCPALQIINLTNCVKISDLGIKGLCCHKDENGDACPNFSLLELSVNGTKVTKEGIKFALNNCPNLSKIDHDNFGQMFYEIHQDSASKGVLVNPKTYNLKSLHMSRYGMYNLHCDALESFSTLCPYITKLSISVKTEARLNICTQFALLKEVNFFFEIPCNILPFLKARGKILKSLYINSRNANSSVSAASLVQLCPRLECLSLDYLGFEEIKPCVEPGLHNDLPYLKKLHVISDRNEYLEESMLFLITRTPNLKQFRFTTTPKCRFKSSAYENILIQLPSTLEKLDVEGVAIDEVEVLDDMQALSI